MWETTRTMRVVLAVTVHNGPMRRPIVKGADEEMQRRVISALLPEPKEAVATGEGEEYVTVEVTDVEVTS